jgi:hypothetical protein
VVKKLEKEEIATSIKLHKKEVPRAINEVINMNKEKDKKLISHDICTDVLSMFSKNK